MAENFTKTGGTFNHGAGTAIFDATTGSPRTITSDSAEFFNLEFDDGGKNITFELQDALDVDGDLTITGGTLDTKSGSNNAISIAGDWTNNDTFSAQVGTVTFDGETSRAA